MPSQLVGPRGSEIIAALKEAGVEFVAALPDALTSKGFMWPLSTDTQLTLIRVCKEDEGISLCAGLSFCNRRAVLSMQYTGFLDSVNSVRATAAEYNLPICMIIGLLGKEPDQTPVQSNHYGTRITKGVLDLMGVDNLCIEDSADVGQLVSGISRAYELSRPFAALIGREVRP